MAERLKISSRDMQKIRRNGWVEFAGAGAAAAGVTLAAVEGLSYAGFFEWMAAVAIPFLAPFAPFIIPATIGLTVALIGAEAMHLARRSDAKIMAPYKQAAAAAAAAGAHA